MQGGMKKRFSTNRPISEMMQVKARNFINTSMVKAIVTKEGEYETVNAFEWYHFQ